MPIERTCPISGQAFIISDLELDYYRNLNLAPPTLSPAERQRRRISFRNFTSLYHRPCSKTAKQIISMYDENALFPVFAYDEWWKDDWDPKDFAQEIDFSVPFFEQYAQLSTRVPRFSASIVLSENCPYGNAIIRSKDCYMTFGCVNSQSCFYGHIVWDCEGCIDCLYAYKSQWCSNCIDIVNCYEIHYSQESVNCQSSYFLYDCRNCTQCFACFGLRNKEFCLHNKQLTKDQYQAELQKLLPLNQTKVTQLSDWVSSQLRLHAVVPTAFNTQSEDVIGHHIYYSKSCNHCFDIKRCEDSNYCWTAQNVQNCFDISFSGGGNSRFCTECLSVAGCERAAYSHLLMECADVAYSEFCFYSQNLFGCNGLRNSQYCILNKQYSREEYFELREKVISLMIKHHEWGQFFPVRISPFAYNEAIVGDYHPSNEHEVTKHGWRWRTESLEANSLDSMLDSDHIPEFAEGLSYDLLGRTFKCSETKKGFRFIKAELDLYKRLQLPAPQTCFKARHLKRMQTRPERKLFPSACAACHQSILSAFEQNRFSGVLCDECYLKSLYSN